MARMHIGRRAGITIAVVVGLLVALLLLDLVTSSPQLCASCHEMSARHDSWAQSSHVSVTCVECHTPPRPWYAWPVSVYDQVWLVGRDVVRHLQGDYEDPVDSPVAGVPPMADDVCLQCHDPNRQATSGYRIKIDHVEHAERNGSCVSCHVRTAHPVESRGTPLTLMGQCFTCHGTQPDSTAPGACILCHPSDYELKPESHVPESAWLQQHAPVSETDRTQCDMCHVQKFCDDCHGLEMPHPDGWAEGEDGHAVYAEKDRSVCEQCHTEKPDLCGMCHHEAYDPEQGTWVQQHFIEAETQGTDYCFECHLPAYCVRCHVVWSSEGVLPAE